MTDAGRVITVRTIYEQLAAVLALHWPQPYLGADTILEGDEDRPQIPTVGLLNFIHPPRVQIIGAAEADYLTTASADQRSHIFERIATGDTVLAVMADGVQPDRAMRTALDSAGIAVFETGEPTHRVSYHLRHYLGRALAQRITVHGVFLEILSLGVLLTGDPAIGKSELALELIARGHRLVADDAPEFALLGPGDLNGGCPPVLQDFLEVRGLGVLNIREMFGEAGIKRRKQLGLIIRLVRPEDPGPPEIDRLSGSRQHRSILDTALPEVTLPIAPGRNLAVLVEAACRDQLLRLQGYSSDADLVNRQQARLQNPTSEADQ